MQILKENSSITLAVLSLSWLTGIVSGILIVLEAAFTITELGLRRYSVIALPFVISFALDASILSGRTVSFKAIVLSASLIISLTFLALVFLYKLKHSVVYGILIIILTTSVGYQCAVGLEFLA